jgi:DNA-binding winged helix-turn-helix (wHTH) protein
VVSANGGNSLVRFGTFEVDLRAGELRRNGARVRLQEQPLQVLAMLLERPGEVVTREELHGRLWNSDTFVDFDHGLNAAIKRLRDALGDSAENPRFVETLARRGYRFIAPVENSKLPVSPLPVVTPSRSYIRVSPLAPHTRLCRGRPSGWNGCGLARRPPFRSHSSPHGAPRDRQRAQRSGVIGRYFPGREIPGLFRQEWVVSSRPDLR